MNIHPKYFYRPTGAAMSTPVSLLNGSQTRLVNSDLLHRLDGLSAIYHRQWWCHGQMFYHFKLCHGFLNGLALLVMAAGIVVEAVWENSFALVGFTAFGTVVKVQKVFIQSGHVSIRLHDLRKDVARIENLCARTTFRRI